MVGDMSLILPSTFRQVDPKYWFYDVYPTILELLLYNTILLFWVFPSYRLALQLIFAVRHFCLPLRSCLVKLCYQCCIQSSPTPGK